MNMCDEAGVIMEQRRTQEEELRQCFEWHTETFDPTGRIVDAVTEHVWKMSQRSDTKQKNLIQDWDTLFMNLVKEHGWTKDVQDVGRIWMSTK